MAASQFASNGFRWREGRAGGNYYNGPTVSTETRWSNFVSLSASSMVNCPPLDTNVPGFAVKKHKWGV